MGAARDAAHRARRTSSCQWGHRLTGLRTLTRTWSCRIDLSCISRTKCSSHVPGSRPSVRRQRVLRWLKSVVSVATAVTPRGGSSVTRLVYVSEKARKPSVSVASKLAGPWRAQMREAEHLRW